MNRVWWLLGGLVAVGCKATTTAPSSVGKPPPNAAYLGDWVVIADAIGRGDTGTLHLRADGTFVAEYTMSNGDGQFAKDANVEKKKRVVKNAPERYSGSYTVSEEKIAPYSITMLTFTITEPKPAQSGPAFRLIFDADRKLLHDMMTVAYSRPGDEERARKYYERK